MENPKNNNMLTKRKSHIYKKRPLFAKKKDPYLQKKDPYLQKKRPLSNKGRIKQGSIGRSGIKTFWELRFDELWQTWAISLRR